MAMFQVIIPPGFVIRISSENALGEIRPWQTGYKTLQIIANYYLKKSCTAEQGIVGVVRNFCRIIRVDISSENLPEYSFSHRSIEISLGGVQTVYIVISGLPQFPAHHSSPTGNVQNLERTYY